MMPLAVLRFDLDPTFGSPRGPALLLLLAFFCSFGFIRTSARLMRSPRVPWWPGSVTTDSGLHIHHLVWGIVLILASGFVAFATELQSPWGQITAVVFGIGAGFTLDEFALWLHLEDVYWAKEGRASLDAVVLATVFAIVVVLGIHPVGLREPVTTLVAVGAVLMSCLLAGLTFLKGRYVLGFLALHLWPLGLWTTVRLAKPDSPWARRRYDREKLERARHRYRPDRPAAKRRDKLLDLLGGAPSAE
jgi:hypothetical protein